MRKCPNCGGWTQPEYLKLSHPVDGSEAGCFVKWEGTRWAEGCSFDEAPPSLQEWLIRRMRATFFNLEAEEADNADA